MNSGSLGNGSGYQQVAALALAPSVLARFGVEAAPLLTSCGLPPDALDSPDRTIPFTTAGAFLEACVEASRCQHFGLLIGKNATCKSVGPLGTLIRHAPTLGDALRDFVSNHHRNADGGLFYLWPAGEQVSLAYAVYNSGDTKWAPLLADTVLGAASQIIRDISGVSPDEVVMARQAPADASEYTRHFNAPLRFNAEMSALVFSNRAFDRPIDGADAAIRKQALALVERFWASASPGFVTRIQRAIFPNILSADLLSLSSVAGVLSLHPRTVNRRLKESGTTFHAEVERLRYELARQLLGNTAIPVTQISQAFGYASVGVFSRAFHRWSGRPPSDWRERR